MATVIQVLNISQFPSCLNDTFVTLILKRNCVVKVADFRSISLCNIIYKLISKTIAIRLKNILPLIISESQSTFISERQVTDNILITYDILHFLRRKKKGK